MATPPKRRKPTIPQPAPDTRLVREIVRDLSTGRFTSAKKSAKSVKIKRIVVERVSVPKRSK